MDQRKSFEQRADVIVSQPVWCDAVLFDRDGAVADAARVQEAAMERKGEAIDDAA